MVNEIKNQDSIKVDDIFYTDRHCGVKGHYIQFFQVVALKENNQVILREVERKLDSYNEENRALVIPSKNQFKDGSPFIEDNNIGIVKVVEYDVNSKDNDTPYIIMSPLTSKNKESISINAYLWDGQPKCHYNDLFEYVNEEKI